MRGPKPPEEELSDEERQGLEVVVRRHATAQQVALRARIILAAADGFNNVQTARLLGVNINKVMAFIDYYNRNMAKPFKWTYQGKVFVG